MALHSSDTRDARFTRVYEEHLETIRRYVWRRDPELVDDVVAETFLVAWRWLADAVPPLDCGGAPHEAAALGEALRGLSPRDREVLLLAVWDGLDRASIAAALGCSRANVSVRLHRARRRLEGSLAAPHHDLGARIALAPRRR
jgi:RNA polymerase sigma-70 factor (ECF subfamily)